MRKQALIHLHQLGFALREEVEASCDVSTGTFDAYEEMDVGPSSIPRRKEAHREALGRLLDGIEDAVEEAPDVEPRGRSPTLPGEQ